MNTKNKNKNSYTNTKPDLELTELPQDPFTDTDDPDLFYPEHTRIQRLRLLLHLTSLDDLLLIVGQPGAGKTMLLKQFLLQAKETASINLIDAHDIKSEIQFITTIAETLNLELTKKEPEQPLIKQLLNAIADLKKTELRTILAIDNIHQLDVKSLQHIEALSHHAKKHEKPLHIVMAGNLEIQKKLEQPGLENLKKKILHTFEVPPFDEHQTKEYILHRLLAANYHNHSRFTPAVIKKIYKKSEGLPERINALARQTLGPQEQNGLLSMAPSAPLEKVTVELQEKEPSSSIVQQFQTVWNRNKLIPILLLASIAAFIFFLQSTISGHFSKESTNQRTEVLNLPVIEKQIEPEKVLTHIEKPLEEPTNNDVQPEALQPITKTLTATVTATQAPPEKVLEEKPKTIETTPSPLEQAVSTEPEITKKLEQKISASPSPSPSPKPLPVQKIKQTAAPETPKIKTIEWIKKQNKDHYTLQVFAIKKEDAMLGFIKKNQLIDQSSYIRLERNGTNLYAMLYGSYENRNLASKAINKLPAPLASFKPWIRSFGSIQETIKNTP